MTKYQKAIKVLEVCESQLECKKCVYYDDCINSNILSFEPIYVEIEDITKAIEEEKWNVK